MKHARLYGYALLALLMAGTAWYGVWYVKTDLDAMRVAHRAVLSRLQSREARQTAQARVRALALETQDARATLSRATNIDVIEAAKVIESVGPASRTPLKVTGVTSQNIPVAKQAVPLTVVQYSVAASGAFAPIMKMAQLLDVVPLVSRVEQFDLAVASADTVTAAPQWHFTARVRLLTSAHTP